jgi:hypothetical protein
MSRRPLAEAQWMTAAAPATAASMPSPVGTLVCDAADPHSGRRTQRRDRGSARDGCQRVARWMNS